jgi:glycosyltransferase involved in cell wall biosynthesis
MEEVFRRSQVLVMPSSYEGFGIVYLEGMAFGLPAIASLVGAAHEIITPGKNGVLVPAEDAGALETVIRKLCKDRKYLETLSLGAWQRFAEFPSWEESMASVRNYLLEWLKTGR